MTITEHYTPPALPETLASQQAAMLDQLRAVLDGHPAGSAFRLIYAPEALPVAPDEVLVQTLDADRGALVLTPRKLGDLARGDLLHATQIIDPADPALARYAAMPRAECWVKDEKTGIHVMGS